MMLKAVKEHFKLEKEYLTQRPRIKPLTLFFIDDIEGIVMVMILPEA
jgi:type III restriction enzyme